ncbi:hypothetical protein B0H11DRAFT_2400782 [Mycena galericulata]|nr:hypothetical protein B0H11DRAFT_2400782 [Mycena galericulata]
MLPRGLGSIPAATRAQPSAALFSSSARSARGRFPERSGNPLSPSSPYDSWRRPSDNVSSDNINSPQPIFDQPANDSAVEDAWAALKPYLEAQTESIVYAIRSVPSGVRSPTLSPTLTENLTQNITIVSSIVAGNDILHELSEHANKLSEVQSLPDVCHVTKDSRSTLMPRTIHYIVLSIFHQPRPNKVSNTNGPSLLAVRLADDDASVQRSRDSGLEYFREGSVRALFSSLYNRRWKGLGGVLIVEELPDRRWVTMEV